MKKVLIVDSDPSMRQTSCDLIEKTCSGWRNVVASSHEEACEKLQAARDNNEQFNLVVTSFRLPERRDGVLLAKHIETYFPDVPCIIFSGGDPQDISTRMLDCGVSACPIFTRPKSDIRDVLAAYDPQLTPFRVVLDSKDNPWPINFTKAPTLH